MRGGFAILFGAVLVAAFASLFAGAAELSPRAVLAGLFGEPLFRDEAGFEGGVRPGKLGWLCGLMAADRAGPSSALL